MEILLQIIDEEINRLLLEDWDDDYGSYGGGSTGTGKGGLGRIVDRGNFVGMLLSPIGDAINAVKFRAAEAGIKAVKTVGELIANTVSALLPYNTYLQREIDDYFPSWEAKALSGLDRQFAKERKELDEGWELFKTDFWGIGFVASPMNAIAGLAVGGKALDAAFSVLNIASGGRAERVYDLISGERITKDIFEAAEEEKEKPEFKDLPEEEKKKVLAELMKNPEVTKAVNDWSAKNLPKVLSSVFHDMNKTIVTSGKATPQEIQSYKAMAPDLTKTLFDRIKDENKGFKVVPSPKALSAASKAVEAEIQSMPDLPEPAKPIKKEPKKETDKPDTVAKPTTAKP